MRRKLPTIALACNNARIGNRASVKIIFAVQQDVGMITESDISNVADESNIRREK